MNAEILELADTDIHADPRILFLRRLDSLLSGDFSDEMHQISARFNQDFYGQNQHAADVLIEHFEAERYAPEDIENILCSIALAQISSISHHTRAVRNNIKESIDSVRRNNGAIPLLPQFFDTEDNRVLQVAAFVEFVTSAQDMLAARHPELNILNHRYFGNHPLSPRRYTPAESLKTWGIACAGNRPGYHATYKGGSLVEK